MAENIQNLKSPILDKIFGYDNYRKFMNDFFEEKKLLMDCFSQRYFAQKCGFSSPSYCRYIVTGKYNLSYKTIKKIIKGMDLKGKAAKYFETLVKYNQSEDEVEREQYRHELENLRKKTVYKDLTVKQFSIFKAWYYPVLRELAVNAKWNSYADLGNLLNPRVSSEKVKTCMNDLVESDLLIKKNDGSYDYSTPVLTAQKSPVFLVARARKDMLLKGVEAVEVLDASRRYTAYSTISVSKKAWGEIVGLLDETRKNIADIAAEDKSPERVAELIFQLFPMSDDFLVKK